MGRSLADKEPFGTYDAVETAEILDRLLIAADAEAEALGGGGGATTGMVVGEVAYTLALQESLRLGWGHESVYFHSSCFFINQSNQTPDCATHKSLLRTDSRNLPCTYRPACIAGLRTYRSRERFL